MPVLQMCLCSLYRGSSLWELHGCRNSDRINRAVFGLLPKVRTGELSKTMTVLCSYQWESEYGHIEVCLLDEDEHEIVEEHEFQEHE